jgi:hypothetical protein
MRCVLLRPVNPTRFTVSYCPISEIRICRRRSPHRLRCVHGRLSKLTFVRPRSCRPLRANPTVWSGRVSGALNLSAVGSIDRASTLRSERAPWGIHPSDHSTVAFMKSDRLVTRPDDAGRSTSTSAPPRRPWPAIPNAEHGLETSRLRDAGQFRSRVHPLPTEGHRRNGHQCRDDVQPAIRSR